MPTITSDIYTMLDQAYSFFDKRLFSGFLPSVAITFQRHWHAYGYFQPQGFRRKDGAQSSEIALNPDTFLARDDRAILSTLVHEMVHVWQFEFGKPSRNGYHNREFARKMKEVGLIASDTGEPGGKSTGQHMTHYVEPGGRFERLYAEFVGTGATRIEWGSAPHVGAASRPISKLAFTCPSCGQRAWAKPSAKLLCGVCRVDMEGA